MEYPKPQKTLQQQSDANLLSCSAYRGKSGVDQSGPDRSAAKEIRISSTSA